MTTNEPDKHTEENVLAYTAISLCGNPTQGTAPAWHELTAWREGALSSQRSSEVLSHVANDPEYFQQWLDIVEAESWIAEETRSADKAVSVQAIDTISPDDIPTGGFSAATSLVSKAVNALRSVFQQPLPVYGGAFAAVMLAVLIAPLLKTNDGLSMEQQLARSSDAYFASDNALAGTPPLPRITRNLGSLFNELSINDVERLHFQTGLQSFNQKLQTESGQPISDAWQDWLMALPKRTVDCSNAIDSAHCVNVAGDFATLGQWSLLVAAACGTPLAQTPEFWQEQYALYGSMQNLQGVEQSQLFRELLPTLQPQSPQSLCSTVNSIIATGR